MPKGVLTFQRTVLTQDRNPDWFASDATLCDVHIDSKGIIEDMHGLLQVDFANMYIVSRIFCGIDYFVILSWNRAAA